MDMSEHPIQGVMDSAMQKIKEMVDVNTIVGEPLTTVDGTTIVPLSKVSFGFLSGGGDLDTKQDKKSEPFVGGSGAGISISPVAFLVVKPDEIKLLQISNNVTAIDKLVDLAPDLINKLQNLIKPKN